LVGEAAVRRLPRTADAPVVRVPIAVALGLGIVGLILFLLATLSQLNTWSIALLTIVGGGVLLVADRQGIRERLRDLRSWRPGVPTWFEAVVIGLAIGLVTFALLTAFVPEDQSDAMRQHIPIARELWESGSAAEIVPMSVSRRPMQGHLLYAAAYGFGGPAAAKLLQSAVGLTAVAGVAGIAWLVAGRRASVAGAIVFATMPIVLWEFGHAFTDLFPVMFTAAAALCIMLWQRDGSIAWLIIAGALSGFGFTAKLNMGLVSLALAAAIFLVGRTSWQWRERSLALLAFALGNVVIIPWLARTYGITGEVPGLSTLVDQATGILFPDASPVVPAGSPAIMPESDALSSPAKRSPLELLRGLWILTFHGRELGFPIIGRGEIGILPLMLAPLAILGPRTRATAFLAVTAIASYVGWWLTAYQIARHLLPTLAILAALCGIGFASVLAATISPLRRILADAARTGLVLGCLAVPFFWLASPRAQLAVDVILGRESAASYVEREIPAAGTLAAASALLPADTPVGYVSVEWEGPQLYTEARLFYFSVYSLGDAAEDVLANLEKRGVRYFIWNRAKTDPEQWRSTLLSGEFLREHARILAADGNAYLFEVSPAIAPAAGMELTDNLLADPELARVKKRDSPWTTEGKIKRSGDLVEMAPKAFISQRVPVSGGDSYLLLARGACASENDHVELTLRWYDESDMPLGSATEEVIPGTAGSEQFLWRMAPAQAASVSAELAAAKGATCAFGQLGLYDLASRQP
jgi:hypothetical protein